jgi:phage tail sheath gpL-like
MSTITIITSDGLLTFGAARWARDESGDVHLYETGSDDSGATIATIDASAFVAAVAGQLNADPDSPPATEGDREHYHHHDTV